jgi:hypothetical protein
MKKLTDLLNEEENKVITDQLVNEFVQNVLKLSSKDNIFDAFLAEKGVQPYYLSEFVGEVLKKVKTYL